MNIGEEEGGGRGGRRETDKPAYLQSCLCSTDQLPRPTLVALPGPVVAPGANISLRCAGRVPGMSFALYRVGVAIPLQYIDSVYPWADFPLTGAHAPGTYSCYYHTPSAPYVLSQRSPPLVISSEGEVLWAFFRPKGPGTSTPSNLETWELKSTTPSVSQICRRASRLWGTAPTPCLPLFGP